MVILEGANYQEKRKGTIFLLGTVALEQTWRMFGVWGKSSAGGGKSGVLEEHEGRSLVGEGKSRQKPGRRG